MKKVKVKRKRVYVKEGLPSTTRIGFELESDLRDTVDWGRK